MNESVPSGVASVVWAKSDRATGASLSLHRHMSDTAAIAALLWDRWLPFSTRRLIAGSLDDGPSARRRVLWLAAAHDLGKATPAFAMQVPSLRDRMASAGFDFRADAAERRLLPHSLASMQLLTEWLEERHRWARDVARAHAIVAGSHHGVTPTWRLLQDTQNRNTLLGRTAVWRQAQAELAEHAARAVGASDADFATWGRHPLDVRAQVLATAFVIVADWLASDAQRFPFDDASPSPTRAERAWREFAFTPRWSPAPPPRDAREHMASRFTLPAGSTPRPIHVAAIEATWAARGPSLVIVEAPMGEGKTELALVAAEILARASGATGFVVALPTMATSDAMFSRVLPWARRLGGEHRSAFLAHSRASLNDQFQDLARMGRLVSVGEDEDDPAGSARSHVLEAVVALQWLSGRKKGLLADIVVGTIDQVLFAALKTRHLMLRHLAFANKVVVIDEVHAVDTVMDVYLRRTLHWLGAYGVPVVLLSATLPSMQRSALIDAYEEGRRAARPSRSSLPDGEREMRTAVEGPSAAVGDLSAAIVAKRRARTATGATGRAARATGTASATTTTVATAGYPSVTVSSESGVATATAAASGRNAAVALVPMPDDDDALVALLRERLADGGAAVVIRNTVSRAQATARMLEERLGLDAELRLVHGRFVASDRAANDEWLRTTFGPQAIVAAAGRERPRRAVVVATQVVEQSLDVDFDLMVSDLAPADLLLQRIGRLHRHELAVRPHPVASPVCHIVGVQGSATEPPELDPGSAAVYGRAVLLRTVLALREKLDGAPIAIPTDIPALVEATYGTSRPEPPAAWAEAYARAHADEEHARREKAQRAEAFRLRKLQEQGDTIVGWLDRGVGEANEEQGRAQVRDGEDTIEVTLVQRVDGELRTLATLDRAAGLPLPTDYEPERAAALAAAASTIRLPASFSRPRRIGRVIDELEANAFPGWQRSRWLAGALVLVLDEELRGSVDGVPVRYGRERGLEVGGLDDDAGAAETRGGDHA